MSSNMTYKTLYRQFISGATSGSHRKVEIWSDQEYTYLVAYNKWVYAKRERESGLITLYTGWADKEEATNASNIQVGYLMQVVEEMPALKQMFKVEERDDVLVDTEGAEYDSFTVEALGR